MATDRRTDGRTERESIYVLLRRVRTKFTHEEKLNIFLLLACVERCCYYKLGHWRPKNAEKVCYAKHASFALPSSTYDLSNGAKKDYVVHWSVFRQSNYKCVMARQDIVWV